MVEAEIWLKFERFSVRSGFDSRRYHLCQDMSHKNGLMSRAYIINQRRLLGNNQSIHNHDHCVSTESSGSHRLYGAVHFY